MAIQRTRATGRDVARAADVSLNTVSLVVRDSPLVAPATKARVREAITRLGYRPHAAAAALASARSRTLGFLVHRSRTSSLDEVEAAVNIFHNQVLNASINRAQSANHHVLTATADAQQCLTLLHSGRIDGALIDWGTPDEVLDQLLAHGAPLVLLGRDAGDRPMSWVKADEDGGAYQATRHLLSLGHTLLGLIGVAPAFDNVIALERVKGYQRAITEAASPAVSSETARGDWSFKSGYELGRELLSRRPRPTALFVLSEYIGAGTLRAAASLGLRVPHDVALVTTEDSPLVEYLWPRLSAVHVPMYDVGLRATDALLSLLDDPASAPRRIVLPTTFVVRESSVVPTPDVDQAHDGARQVRG